MLDRHWGLFASRHQDLQNNVILEVFQLCRYYFSKRGLNSLKMSLVLRYLIVSQSYSLKRGDKTAKMGISEELRKILEKLMNILTNINPRVLIVDDEAAVRDSLERALSEDYSVTFAADGFKALERLAAERYDLILLDVIMPNLDGLETCQRIRKMGNHTPILMLTARDAVGDRVSGLDAGADDYLPKPFALNELYARMRALLRRSGVEGNRVLEFDDLSLDRATREVFYKGESLELTRTEFSLLELFLLNPRQVLDRSTIYERVWGYDFGFNSNSLDVYIGYLRRKLEGDGKDRLIQTVRGIGYALRE